MLSLSDGFGVQFICFSSVVILSVLYIVSDENKRWLDARGNEKEQKGEVKFSYSRVNQDLDESEGNEVVHEAREVEKSIELSYMNKTSNHPLVVSNLRKIYDRNKNSEREIAVDGVSFQVKSGEVLGVLGPNGAGKTSIISCISSQTSVSGGDILICDKSILTSEGQKVSQEVLSVVQQGNVLNGFITVLDHLNLYTGIKGFVGKNKEMIIKDVMNLLSLNEYKNVYADSLSGGTQRRLCCAIALIPTYSDSNNESVLLLDEISAGVDVMSRRELWKAISCRKDRFASILTTHVMEEADALCDRIAIIVGGKIVALGSSQQLKHKFGKSYRLTLQLRNEVEKDNLINLVITKCHKNASLFSSNSKVFIFELPSEGLSIGDVFTNVESNRERLGILDYSLSQPSLEQVFLSLINK